MLSKIEGIVIRTRNYGETHKLITLYSKQLGKISAISRGASKPKSRLSAASQPFIKAEFLTFITKGLSTIQQADILESHRSIREDIVKTAYAAYVIELTDKLLEDRQANAYLYKQLTLTLSWINEKQEYLIPVIMYELKMFKEAGFAPVVDRCVNCNGKSFPFSFSLQEGGILCTKCRHLDYTAQPLDDRLVKLLALLLNVGLDQVDNISVKQANQKMLKKLLDHYYDHYGGFKLKSQKFLAQLETFEQ